MRQIIFLTILFLSVSCSSRLKKWSPYFSYERGTISAGLWINKGYKYAHIPTAVSTVFDPLQNHLYLVSDNANVDKYFYEAQKDGRINQKRELSCFNNTESTNFIAIIDSDIPRLRPYVTEIKFNVFYNSSEVLDNGIFRSISSENKMDDLMVSRETCVREIDGLKYRVISEIYKIRKA